ncbi:hypothetical protein CHUAL_013902 [Chamberlinius hualienensis]
MVLSVASYVEHLMKLEFDHSEDGLMHDLHNVVITATITCITGGSTAIFSCCSLYCMTHILIDANVIFLIVGLTLDMTTVIQIVEVSLRTRDAIKVCVKIMFGSTPTLEISAWLLIASMILEGLVVFMSLRWMYKMEVASPEFSEESGLTIRGSETLARLNHFRQGRFYERIGGSLRGDRRPSSATNMSRASIHMASISEIVPIPPIQSSETKKVVVT